MNGMLDHADSIRLGAFIGAIALLALLQWRFSLRRDSRPARRQAVNVGLVVIDTLALRLVFPVLAVAFAADVHARGGGLFGALDGAAVVEILIAFLLLDLVIYWQHRLLHRVPLLWRIHRVHHCDTGFDLTTGVRFHPLEILLSMAIKLAAIALLGAHPFAVLLFELALSLGALWTHTDVALPATVDRRIRWLLVTPSMHRIHHSTWRPETDSNYGFHLSVWDRLFGSYRAQPSRPEREMPVGLAAFRDDQDQRLSALLLNPFSTAAARRSKGAAL
ncbi:MAG: sterol desaturase family protein [Wenzhouxiangellaceae bacterium]